MFTCDITKAHSSASNYCLFALSDVSYRFNGENDNVVLELTFRASLCSSPEPKAHR